MASKEPTAKEPTPRPTSATTDRAPGKETPSAPERPAPVLKPVFADWAMI